MNKLPALRLNPVWLLAAQLAALWPHWLWMARRMVDGSDEPWGLLALLTLAGVAWIERRQLLPRIGVSRLLLAAGLTLLASLNVLGLPPLLGAALAVLAVVVVLLGLLPVQRSRLGLIVLALLALPLSASLNFYMGYPLRWVCSHSAAALLAFSGLDIQAQGAALIWHGKTILVDAPCAGIAMLWVGVYVAALMSYCYRASVARTLFNLGMALLIVLLGNILRNTALFYKEAGIVGVPAWTHEGVGLLLFGLSFWLMYRVFSWNPVWAGFSTKRVTPSASSTLMFSRIGMGVWFSVLSLSAAMPLASWSKQSLTQETPNQALEWAEAQWAPKNTMPKRLPLTALEQRFAGQFPGQIGRFSDGRQEWIVRVMKQPTRMLHPAADCFQALGYRLTPAKVHLDQKNEQWRCFRASGKGKNLRVCERIFDGKAGRWTDASAWYWSSVLSLDQHQNGPWWAVTQVEAE